MTAAEKRRDYPIVWHPSSKQHPVYHGVGYQPMALGIAALNCVMVLKSVVPSFWIFSAQPLQRNSSYPAYHGVGYQSMELGLAAHSFFADQESDTSSLVSSRAFASCAASTIASGPHECSPLDLDRQRAVF